MESNAQTPMDSGAAPQVPEQRPVWETLSRREVRLTFGGVMLALFLSSLDQTIVGTAMPRIIADLNGFNHYTWVTTGYMVASTAVVPIVGRLSDIYGRKWLFTGGIIVFLLGSALAGLSQNMTELIAFRALQGLGGGAMMANAFTTIGDLFPPAERAKYQGFMGGIFGLSAIFGPTVGGLVTDSLSWHWIFYINLPLGVPIVALFIVFFPKAHSLGRQHRIDYLGLSSLLLAVVPLLLALSLGGVQFAWTSVQVIGLLGLAVVMALAFVSFETRVEEPLIPLSIFRNPVIGMSMLAIFLTGFGMFGGILFIPLFFQGVLGASATGSGSFLTPMMLSMVGASVLSGQALSRFGGHYRIQGLVGLAIMGVGMLLLSRMTETTTYWSAVTNIVVLGIGLGITMPLYTIAVQNAAPYNLMGIVTSTTQFVRSIGGVLGLAVLGAVMTHRFASAFASAIPAAAKTLLPPDQLSALGSNPQALASPQAQAHLQQTLGQLGPQGAGLAQELQHAMGHALASAIGMVFLAGLASVIVAFVATLFLKEIPLRQRGKPGGAPSTVEPSSGEPSSIA